MSKVVKPYEKEGSKKNQVSNMFDKIAPYYDFLNALLSMGIDTIWRRKAIQLLAKQQPEMVLDVATGTADLAIEAARSLNPKQVIGVDISNEMLDIGRNKVRKQNLEDQISLQEGDSENLNFADNTFDAITVAFGVRNFENLERGLKEMQRVLKSGGQLVVLEFSKPSIFPFRQIFNGYFKYVLPTIGKLTSKDPKAYKYLYESVQAFPDGQNFVSILEKTGFNSNQCKRLSLGICTIYSGIKP